MNSAAPAKIKVLIVEDSKVVAQFLTSVLGVDPRIEVVGIASDGVEGMEAARRMLPDVITMDIHMPRVDGFQATQQIMETCPTPIVIVSANTGEAATSFRAMEAGALAVVARPAGIGHPDHASSVRELLDTVKLMSEVKVVRRWARSRMHAQPRVVFPAEPVRPAVSIDTVLIGASTGGPLALQSVLTGLPRDFPAAVLIVQHMTPGFTPGFADWLSTSSGFPVRIAAHGDLIEPGIAYVAPDGAHMGLTSGRQIVLSDAPPENRMRPSVSYLFRSALAALGPKVIAVILTGMGQDGADELKALKDTGAITIAQDQESSVVHGMPGRAIALEAARYILPPEEISRLLITLLRKP